MPSMLWIAVGITVVVTLLGSVVFQFLTPINDSILSPLEEKCQNIANEGYKIHSVYPDASPDEMPLDDMNRLLYLDKIWIEECVSNLSAEAVFNIAQNVDRDLYSDQ